MFRMRTMLASVLLGMVAAGCYFFPVLPSAPDGTEQESQLSQPSVASPEPSIEGPPSSLPVNPTPEVPPPVY